METAQYDKMKFFRSFLANAIFALNVLLVFLFFFRHRLNVPVWLQPAGRMHPMVLHLPIGILVLAALMVILKKGFKKKSFHNFLNYLLYLSAFTAALTAVMGLLLSTEGGYADDQLQRHTITGVLVSIGTWWVLMVGLFAPEKTTLFNISLAADIVVMLLAGHFGSVLTHGENFVFEPLLQQDEVPLVITDSTSLYAAAIQPVFKMKCFSCHNEKKAKGKLIMTSIAMITEGGKDGPIWVKGDPKNSTIIKRIHLPVDNDDHMPPDGKLQLTDVEKKLIYQWVLHGADLTKPWTKFNAQDSLRKVADLFIHQEQKPTVVHYPFDFASTELIEKLNTPYRSVAQFALDEPALKADFYLQQQFDSKKLGDLLAIKDQLVILNLSSMPVSDADGKTLSQFHQLEKLSLNNTAITPKLLASLQALPKLTSLSLAGTNADQSCAPAIVKIASLKEVFLWNTKLTETEIASLQRQCPGIRWNGGYPDTEMLRLTPPMLLNEATFIASDEKVILKNNLPGTQIRYTIDGTEPDSVGGLIYDQPLPLTGYTVIKARSVKSGWYGSPVATWLFFVKGITPVSSILNSKADKKYPGEGGSTLVNNRKGTAENLKDPNWVGYRTDPMIAIFEMPPASTISSVTFSFAFNTYAYALPPSSLELWAGDDADHLKLIERKTPVQPTAQGTTTVKGIVFTFEPRASRYYKIIATQVARVPLAIAKKAERSWVFCDEVILK